MIISFISKLKELSDKIKDDDVMPWASMLTLYLLLSLFPMIILITELLSRSSLFTPDVVAWLIDILPPSVFGAIEAIAVDIVAKHNDAIIPVTIVMTLWSMSRGMLAIIKSLNKAYQISETRNYFHLRFLALFYTIGMIIIVALTLLLIVFGQWLLTLSQQWIVIPSSLNGLILIFRYGLTIFYTMIFFIALYNLSPTTPIGVWKVLPGSLFTSIGLLALSMLFSIYIKYFSRLSYLYGSLTGFVILILWIYLVSTTIMVGGEINIVFSSKHFKGSK